MVNLLRKIFIKNYQDLSNQNVRASHGKLAACFGVFTNVILFLAKIIFGLIASSISIIGDAINNLSDMGTSLITLVGFNLSNKPADKEHPFGHERIEYIAGLIVSIVIVALALILGYESILKIIAYHKGELEVSSLSNTFQIVTFIILGVAVLFKLVQGIFYKKMSKLINSVTLKASSVDSLTDALATFSILIASLLSYFFNWNFLDGYMGVVVAIFLAFNGIKMIKETCDPLIGTAVDKETINKIIKDVLSYEGILGIHDVMCHMYGPTRMFMSLHAEVSALNNILDSHELIDQIEYEIKNKYKIEIVIHMDPVDDKNPLTLKYKEQVKEILNDIDTNLTFHDFRVVHGTNHTNILFDIVVPFDFKIADEELKNIIFKKLNDESNIKLNLIVNVDRPYVK